MCTWFRFVSVKLSSGLPGELDDSSLELRLVFASSAAIRGLCAPTWANWYLQVRHGNNRLDTSSHVPRAQPAGVHGWPEDVQFVSRLERHLVCIGCNVRKECNGSRLHRIRCPCTDSTGGGRCCCACSRHPGRGRLHHLLRSRREGLGCDKRVLPGAPWRCLSLSLSLSRLERWLRQLHRHRVLKRWPLGRP